MARDKTSSGARRRRWPWVLLGFGVLAFVLVGLALLARPMMDVKPEADAARDELGMAQDAIKAEDVDAAKVHVAAARAHVDEASTLVNGFGGDVWRWVPVGGGAIQDVRHLVGALDQATSIAEIGRRNDGGAGRFSPSQRRQYSRNSICSGVSTRSAIGVLSH